MTERDKVEPEVQQFTDAIVNRLTRESVEHLRYVIMHPSQWEAYKKLLIETYGEEYFLNREVEDEK